MKPPREVELKFEVSPDSLPRLTRALRNAEKRAPADLVSVYYDTKRMTLRKHGLSLRVRQIGDRLVQTVKRQDGGAAPVFDRGEWETDIASPSPDLEAAAKTPVKDVLAKRRKERLAPIFETRVRRTVYSLRNNGSDIEVSVDRGRVEAGDRTHPLCEVELELKRGEPADLFDAAKAFVAPAPGRLAVTSKSDLGYALVSGEEPSPVKARPVTIDPDASAQQAFQIIARSCLHHTLANEALTREGVSEALHQMRVAIRRLRAAMSLFSDMIEGAQTNHLKSELRWVASELGRARELDVLLTEIANASSGPKRKAIEALGRKAKAARKKAYLRARAAIDSARFRRLVLDIAAWIEAGDWLVAADAAPLRKRRIKEGAADELQRRTKKIVKKGRHLRDLDPGRRHKLRIRSKKLRYAAEFLASIFDGDRACRRKAFVSTLTRLQDALGGLNDIAMHEPLLKALSVRQTGTRKSRGSETDFAAGEFAGLQEARAEPLMAEAESAYKALAKTKPFWS